MQYSLRKAYEAGIDALYMGGEILEDNFYREKDILEDDYSCPTLSGVLEIRQKECIKDGLFVVYFKDGGGLFLTEKEFNAGLIL